MYSSGKHVLNKKRQRYIEREATRNWPKIKSSARLQQYLRGLFTSILPSKHGTGRVCTGKKIHRHHLTIEVTCSQHTRILLFQHTKLILLRHEVLSHSSRNVHRRRAFKPAYLQHSRRGRGSGKHVEAELHAAQHGQPNDDREIRLPQEKRERVVVPRVELRGHERAGQRGQRR